MRVGTRRKERKKQVKKSPCLCQPETKKEGGKLSSYMRWVEGSKKRKGYEVDGVMLCTLYQKVEKDKKTCICPYPFSLSPSFSPMTSFDRGQIYCAQEGTCGSLHADYEVAPANSWAVEAPF